MHTLSDPERIHYRDLLREARYGALADAEGFQQMCFAIEALGKRLNPNAQGLGHCQVELKALAAEAGFLDATGEIEGSGKRFDAVFIALKDARDDIAHTGAYARHVAVEGVVLCLVLEDALTYKRITVGDFMVSNPVGIQPWQSVGYARQLMLLNSFSYLPMWDGTSWWLLSDMAVAKYLRGGKPVRGKKSMSITDAKTNGLILTKASTVNVRDAVTNLLEELEQPGLWLVVQDDFPVGHLVGVLSPFELM